METSFGSQINIDQRTQTEKYSKLKLNPCIFFVYIKRGLCTPKSLEIYLRPFNFVGLASACGVMDDTWYPLVFVWREKYLKPYFLLQAYVSVMYLMFKYVLRTRKSMGHICDLLILLFLSTWYLVVTTLIAVSSSKHLQKFPDTFMSHYNYLSLENNLCIE